MPGRDRSRPPVLLVTAAGTAAGLGLLRACGHYFPEVRRIAADTNPSEYCAASMECDVYAQTSSVAQGTFVEEIGELVRREKVTSYIPILDEEIVWAPGFAQSNGLRTTAPLKRAAETCFDKLRTFELLRRVSIPTPDTQLGGLPLVIRGPSIVAKPRRGRGSQGFRVLSGPEDVPLLGPDCVIQTRLFAPEVTVDAFRSGTFFRAVCRERIETRSGVCTKARVFSDSTLEGIAEQVGSVIGLVGTYCIQLMRSAAGEWQVTDVNPRPGAGTALSEACGVRFLAAHVAEALGRDASCHLPPLEREHCVVRVYQELVTR